MTLKPGLVPDMRSGSHRPPQTGQMPLASRPPELPDRMKPLRPQPRPRSRQLAMLRTSLIEITQLKPQPVIYDSGRFHHKPTLWHIRSRIELPDLNEDDHDAVRDLGK